MRRMMIVIAFTLFFTACGAQKENPPEQTVPVFPDETVADQIMTADETLTKDVSVTSDAESIVTAAVSKPEPKPADSKPEPKPEEVIMTGSERLEIYSKVMAEDFITELNGELTDPNALIDTLTLGEHEVSVNCRYDGYIYQKKFTYTVEDTTPPVILNSGENAAVLTGSDFDLNALIGYADNYDPSPSLYYDGYVETSVQGVYPITVYITDNSGNQTSWNMNVTVADEISQPVDDNIRIDFEDFKNQYADKGTAFGIDVSKWQGYIDYEAVRNAGCDFVIIRMGYTSGGLPEYDDYYFTNIENARSAGLKVGVYYYSTDSSVQSAEYAAQWAADNLGGAELDFPIAFDWEDFTNFQEYGISTHELNEIYHAFSDKLSENGYDTMLYSSKIFLENVWENPDDETVWLAHYAENTDYTGKYVFWQRCGWGNISGIYGDVDLNVYTYN